MANNERLRPLHHTTCDIQISGVPPLRSIRVVITPQGILDSLVNYFGAQENRSKSPAWRNSVARSVGYFYDFSIEARKLYETNPSPANFLSEFAYHLLAGTIDTEGDDPLGLYWPKQPFATVDTYIKNLTAFGDYCERVHGAKAANPWRKSLKFSEQLARFRAWDRRNNESLIQNIASRKDAWRNSEITRTLSLGYGPRFNMDEGIAFPEGRFDELITEGFIKPGSGHRSSLIDRLQIRDAMIAVLQRGAGFRESEPFHLYIDDVWQNPTKPGSALVRIHHPSESRVLTFDPIAGRETFIKRGNYLKPLGYAPRHLLHGKERAGWKDPLLIRDSETKSLYMEAYWFPQGYGELFWQLYKAYLVIRPRTSHPFLFVTERGERTGEPYKIAQYEKKLKRAVERIGLIYSKSQGTTSHGFRHRYGHDLRVAGIERETRQKLMHHKNPNSTDQYGQILSREVNEKLERAKVSMSRNFFPLTSTTSE